MPIVMTGMLENFVHFSNPNHYMWSAYEWSVGLHAQLKKWEKMV